jgi:hypothetical protein
MGNALERLQNGGRAPAARAGSEATAVEMQRAIAEVQAAVTVAQSIRRDTEAAYGAMEQACTSYRLAQRAFYAVPNRGNGPSIHLMRELARVWGNIDYGVRETRRDDAAGVSEVQAYAWDLETNTRAVRSFVVPHIKDTRQGPKAITDQADIYANNQNIGARAVRECIAAVLPAEFAERAQDICKVTLDRGNGESLADRVGKAVTAFQEIGIRKARLEAKIGRKAEQWSGRDIGQLLVWHTTITRDGVHPDEIFGEEGVQELAGGKPTAPPQQPQPPAPAEQPATATDKPVQQPQAPQAKPAAKRAQRAAQPAAEDEETLMSELQREAAQSWADPDETADADD